MPPVPQDQQYNPQFGGPDGMHHFFNGSGGAVMALIFVAFVVVVGALLLSLVMRRRVQSHQGGSGTFLGRPTGGSPAVRLLDERLARGEVDPEDYRVRRELLTTRG